MQASGLLLLHFTLSHFTKKKKKRRKEEAITEKQFSLSASETGVDSPARCVMYGFHGGDDL